MKIIMLNYKLSVSSLFPIGFENVHKLLDQEVAMGVSLYVTL